MARSRLSMAMTTPAQKARGLARMTYTCDLPRVLLPRDRKASRLSPGWLTPVARQLELSAVALGAKSGAEVAFGSRAGHLEFAGARNPLRPGQKDSAILGPDHCQLDRVVKRHDLPEPAMKRDAVMAIINAAKARVQRAMMAGLAVAPSARPVTGQVSSCGRFNGASRQRKDQEVRECEQVVAHDADSEGEISGCLNDVSSDGRGGELEKKLK